MYDNISPNLNFVEQEKKIKQFWDDNKIFEKSIETKAKGTPYVFYDGPPLVSFDFIKDDGKWNLKTIRHIPFDKSDLADFLRFYSRFTQDSCFNYASLARSIHISMMDPEDEEQSIDGFVTRDQWNTVHSGIPKGVITNIRYGQRYKAPKRILMEKISMGNGMSETFAFRRNGTRWELSGYEN